MAQINKPGLHFNTKLFTGNGANDNAQTGVGFQPDWTWIKARSQAYDHMIFDRVRQGAAAQPFDIRSNNNSGQSTDTSGVKSFDSDGFTLNNGGYVNGNSVTFASWNWKANGAGSANTDGTINTTSTSVNTTAGFSISTYTGTGANASFGHGLGVKPAMFIIKRLSAVEDWAVYHKSMTASHYLNLNQNIAKDTNNRWNGEPTASLINLQNHDAVNGSGSTYVCYAFAEKKGYSKFGSYTGNGNADGPFIYLGFKPAFVIIKQTNTTNNWYMWDNKTSPFNVTNAYLRPDTAGAAGSYDWLDFVSNGIKIRNTSSGASTSGGTYIYMAFAESALVGTNNIPGVAR